MFKKLNLKSILIVLLAAYLQECSAFFSGSNSKTSSNSLNLPFTHFGHPFSSSNHLANLTSASHFTNPFYYEYERDPRQWLGYGYGTAPWNYNNGWLNNGINSIEAVVVCLLVVVGIGVIGLPMLLLLFSLFSSNIGNVPSTGFNFIPPTSTTTVNGRRRRSLNEHKNNTLVQRLLQISSLDDLLELKEFNGLTDKLMANVKPELREKAIEYFNNFTNAANKIEYIKSLIQH